MSAPSRRYSASANDNAAITTSWPNARMARRDFGRIGTRRTGPRVSDKRAFYSKDRHRREIGAAWDNALLGRNAVRPSRRPLRGLLRMTFFLTASKDLRHPE